MPHRRGIHVPRILDRLFEFVQELRGGREAADEERRAVRRASRLRCRRVSSLLYCAIIYLFIYVIKIILCPYLYEMFHRPLHGSCQITYRWRKALSASTRLFWNRMCFAVDVNRVISRFQKITRTLPPLSHRNYFVEILRARGCA